MARKRPRDAKKVFLVHGRDLPSAQAVTLFLRALGLSVEPFEQLASRVSGSPYIGDVVRTGMSEAQAFVVLLTPDEWCELDTAFRKPNEDADETAHWLPRPNVMLEAGMALMCDEKRTILVAVGGDIFIPSDLHGRHVLHLTNAPESRDSFKARLMNAGCQIPPDIMGHHNVSTAGNFDIGRRLDAAGSRPRNAGMGEVDIVRLLQGWADELPLRHASEPIRTAVIDRELGLSPGTAKGMLEKALKLHPVWRVEALHEDHVSFSRNGTPPMHAPEIVGLWRYRCTSTDGTYRQGGLVEIAIENSPFGLQLNIRGERRWHEHKKGTKWAKTILPAPLAWYNTWGAVTRKNEFRYDYVIEVNGHTLHGYATGVLHKATDPGRDKITGQFWQLGPEQAMAGTEELERVEPGDSAHIDGKLDGRAARPLTPRASAGGGKALGAEGRARAVRGPKR